jgi:hypothetical protein
VGSEDGANAFNKSFDLYAVLLDELVGGRCSGADEIPNAGEAATPGLAEQLSEL